MNKIEALVELQLNATAEIKANKVLSEYTAQQIHKMVSQMTLGEINEALVMFRHISQKLNAAK